MSLTKFFGLAEVDSLLSEFILDDLNDQVSESAKQKKQQKKRRARERHFVV